MVQNSGGRALDQQMSIKDKTTTQLIWREIAIITIRRVCKLGGWEKAVKAAVLHAYNEPLVVDVVTDPDVPSTGIVIEVIACGVCRSDWHGWRGSNSLVRPPHILGHELAGVVVAVGGNCDGFEIGQRVTAPVIMGCGHCPTCRSGETTACSDQFVIGFTAPGAFAQYIAIPNADANVVVIPENISFEDAAALGCRTTTAFRGVVDRGKVRPGEVLAVHGCGGVGLSAVMIGKAVGALVVAVDIVPEKLSLATEIGADFVLNAQQVPDVGEAIREITAGGAHVSIEALGSTQTLLNSLRCLRKLGRHVQLGQPFGSDAYPQIPLLETVYYKQISIIGSRGLPSVRFANLFNLIESSSMPLHKLIKKRIDMSAITTIFEGMSDHSDVGLAIVNRFD
jgi:alcohol dehydrogenase